MDYTELINTLGTVHLYNKKGKEITLYFDTTPVKVKSKGLFNKTYSIYTTFNGRYEEYKEVVGNIPTQKKVANHIETFLHYYPYYLFLDDIEYFEGKKYKIERKINQYTFTYKYLGYPNIIQITGSKKGSKSMVNCKNKVTIDQLFELENELNKVLDKEQFEEQFKEYENIQETKTFKFLQEENFKSKHNMVSVRSVKDTEYARINIVVDRPLLYHLHFNVHLTIEHKLSNKVLISQSFKDFDTFKQAYDKTIKQVDKETNTLYSKLLTNYNFIRDRKESTDTRFIYDKDKNNYQYTLIVDINLNVIQLLVYNKYNIKDTYIKTFSTYSELKDYLDKEKYNMCEFTKKLKDNSIKKMYDTILKEHGYKIVENTTYYFKDNYFVKIYDNGKSTIHDITENSVKHTLKHFNNYNELQDYLKKEAVKSSIPNYVKLLEENGYYNYYKYQYKYQKEFGTFTKIFNLISPNEIVVTYTNKDNDNSVSYSIYNYSQLVDELKNDKPKEYEPKLDVVEKVSIPLEDIKSQEISLDNNSASCYNYTCSGTTKATIEEDNKVDKMKEVLKSYGYSRVDEDLSVFELNGKQVTLTGDGTFFEGNKPIKSEEIGNTVKQLEKYLYRQGELFNITKVLKEYGYKLDYEAFAYYFYQKGDDHIKINKVDNSTYISKEFNDDNGKYIGDIDIEVEDYLYRQKELSQIKLVLDVYDYTKSDENDLFLKYKNKADNQIIITKENNNIHEGSLPLLLNAEFIGNHHKELNDYLDKQDKIKRIREAVKEIGTYSEYESEDSAYLSFVGNYNNINIKYYDDNVKAYKPFSEQKLNRLAITERVDDIIEQISDIEVYFKDCEAKEQEQEVQDMIDKLKEKGYKVTKEY